MTTTSTAVFTFASQSAIAGHELGEQIRAELDDEQPDVVIVFAAARYDHAVLLRALAETCRPRVLLGASSSGELTHNQRGEGSACALAIKSSVMTFSASIAHRVSVDPAGSARRIASGFRGHASSDPYRAALVFTDAGTDELVEQLAAIAGDSYALAGGGAAGATTSVFHGTDVMTDAVVALEILSHKPIGLGVEHGWEPASTPYRVTAARGTKILTLDDVPAATIFDEHARTTGQRLDRSDPQPYFVHNILGIETSAGHKLRVPLSLDADGGVTCAAEVPVGATVHVMKAAAGSASAASAKATRAAIRQLGGHSPSAALFFDCVATRLRLGDDDFGFELAAVQRELGRSALAGCNTHGQIARADGQFSGFHNCTAVVLALPR